MLKSKINWLVGPWGPAGVFKEVKMNLSRFNLDSIEAIGSFVNVLVVGAIAVIVLAVIVLM